MLEAVVSLIGIVLLLLLALLAVFAEGRSAEGRWFALANLFFAAAAGLAGAAATAPHDHPERAMLAGKPAYLATALAFGALYMQVAALARDVTHPSLAPLRRLKLPVLALTLGAGLWATLSPHVVTGVEWRGGVVGFLPVFDWGMWLVIVVLLVSGGWMMALFVLLWRHGSEHRRRQATWVGVGVILFDWFGLALLAVVLPHFGLQTTTWSPAALAAGSMVMLSGMVLTRQRELEHHERARRDEAGQAPGERIVRPDSPTPPLKARASSSDGSEQLTSCPNENLIYGVVAGTVAAPLEREVQRHAEGCADCRAVIAWVRSDLAASAAAATLTADAQALLVAERAVRADLTGHIIADKYRLGRRVGAGGMGVVYEAVNTWTERRVALKLLHPWFSSDPETVQRFHYEARNASRITHPNIVDVFDLGQDATDQSLYMVQELLTGQTLRQYCAEHPRLSVAEVAEILRPIMEALAAAHEMGIVHRDVKPENIILSTDRTGQRVPKLIDFGVSKLTEGGLPSLLQTGRAVGTPLYMSPEQLHADKLIDGRTDVWAMGVVLFEVLSGQRPFEAESHAAVAVRILTGDAPSLAELAPPVPPPVAAVVARALARDREARWPSMRAMIDAFAAAIGATPDGGAPATRVR
jgi:serine/threonine-protein kinase